MGQTRELRIAPVMTGGTSLAIWMGGATYELYRMARSWIGAEAEPADAVAGEPGAAGRAVYADLLALVDTRPVIDVITGTSAGGLNGTLLATACHLSLPTRSFRSIRDTWLEVADIEQLMRKPSDSDPPSLLRGDDYFAVQVQDALDDWHDEARPPEGSDAGWNRDVDLVTTVTTIAAEPRSRADHFGEQLNEVSHAQQLRFRSSAGHFSREGTRRVAVAARTSASIPGVFEPSFLPVGLEDARASGRPDFADQASFGTSKWAVDGGVVVNLPLGEALARVHDRSSSGEVRRVVLYVSPTPSVAGASRADRSADEPTIRTALQTVVLAPRAEGIAEDVDVIERHNRAVDLQIEARQASRWLVSAMDLADDMAGQDPLTLDVLQSYRRLRTRTSVQRMLERVQQVSNRLPADRLVEIETRLQPARRALFPPESRPWDLDNPHVPWAWGIEPVEQAVGLALSMVNRALATLPGEGAGPVADSLRTAKERVHEARRLADEVRDLDTRYWEQHLAEMMDKDPPPGVDELVGWATRAYREWPGTAVQLDAFTKLRDAHAEVAGALEGALDAIADAAGAAVESKQADLVREGRALRREVEVFTGAVDVSVQRLLLASHVVQTVFGGDAVANEQRIELMQVSWNSWNGLDEARTPAEKLAGPELGRLGAFVKPSWRANDWFWGRMDASYRLVLLLLEPTRIRRLDAVPTLEALVRTHTGAGDASLPDDVAKELVDLADVSRPAPSSLPAVARALARRLQATIACEELDSVADAVRRSERAGGNEASSRPFLRAIDRVNHTGKVTESDVQELVTLMRIGQDSVREELGFGLMNRVSTGLVSVVINAATGTRSGLSLLSRVLRPARAPAQGVASLVRTMSRDNKLAQALTAAVLAIAGAIVALAIVGQPIPSGTFVIAAVLLTLVFVGAMLRSGFLWLSLLFSLAAGVIVLTVVGEDIHDVLHDVPRPVEAAAPVEEGATLHFEDEAQVRVDTDPSPDGERYEDIELPAGSSIELTGGEAEVRGPATEDTTAEWKRWGFTDTVSIARVVLALLALAAIVVLFKEWRTTSPGTRVSRAGWIGLAIGAAIAVQPAARAALTDDAPQNDAVDDVKDWLVEAGDALDGFNLEVVLVVLVVLSIAISLGADLTATRMARSLRRRVLDTFRSGGRRLHRLAEGGGVEA